MSEPSRLHRKLNVAAVFIVLGLLVETTTLYWANPGSFLTFLIIGGSFVAVGVIAYLLAIVGH